MRVPHYRIQCVVWVGLEVTNFWIVYGADGKGGDFRIWDMVCDVVGWG